MLVSPSPTARCDSGLLNSAGIIHGGGCFLALAAGLLRTSQTVGSSWGCHYSTEGEGHPVTLKKSPLFHREREEKGS